MYIFPLLRLVPVMVLPGLEILQVQQRSQRSVDEGENFKMSILRKVSRKLHFLGDLQKS